FTALLPPPPTPTTLMRAPVRASSASFNRSPVGSMSPSILCRVSPMVPTSFISLEKFFEQRAQPPGHAAERAGPDRTCRFAGLIAVRIHHEADRRRKRGVVDVIRQSTEPGRRAAPDRQIENLLRDFADAFEHGAAAREHDPGVQRFLETC